MGRAHLANLITDIRYYRFYKPIVAIDAHLAIFGDRCIKSPGVSLDLGITVKVRHAHKEVCFKISADHAITKTTSPARLSTCQYNIGIISIS